MPATSSTSIDRAEAVNRFVRMRERSRRLFDLLSPEAYYTQPIALRHPIVFYEGHLPAFSFNTLIKRALGRPGIDAGLEGVFARGIDPEHVSSSTGAPQWPRRDEVLAFVEEADRRVVDALRTAPIEQPGHPLLDRGEAVYAILEHEAMHQETLLYMWHQLPYSQKRPPAGIALHTEGPLPREETIEVPAGRATIGARRGDIPFGWDNEFEAVEVHVPAFTIDRYNITNAAFLEFVEAGGYRDPRWWTEDALAWLRDEEVRHPRFWLQQEGHWYWRGMFAALPLPPSWPVYVSQSEASAYARWRGRRLPTEAEYLPSGVRHANWRSASISVGRRTACGDSRALRFLRMGSAAGRAGIRQAAARGVSTIWSATDGNGRRRCSRRCQGSGRSRRIPSTPRISSMAATSSCEARRQPPRASCYARASATGSARTIHTSMRRSAASPIAHEHQDAIGRRVRDHDPGHRGDSLLPVAISAAASIASAL